MTEAVLDASAIVAVLRQEPGAEIVAEVLARDRCAASAVNIAEVVSKLTDRGVSPELIASSIQGLELEIHAFTLEAAFSTGHVRARTRAGGLSLADRACVALGERLGLPLVTTDRVWATLELQVPVILARPDRT